MLCQVGQTFLHFQWDILLLEAGALGVLVSPLWPGQQRGSLAQDRVTMFLVRSVRYPHCPPHYQLFAGGSCSG